jgi:hypothetical protein
MIINVSNSKCNKTNFVLSPSVAVGYIYMSCRTLTRLTFVPQKIQFKSEERHNVLEKIVDQYVLNITLTCLTIHFEFNWQNQIESSVSFVEIVNRREELFVVTGGSGEQLQQFSRSYASWPTLPNTN